MTDKPANHFQGMSVFEHLKAARLKGTLAGGEPHGTEMPGHLAAGADCFKETAIALLLGLTVLEQLDYAAVDAFFILLFFSAGWLIWKVGRSAMLAWTRLERLHRLIEEERWEIEHHREQEREELKEMYQIKGFSGKQLDDVINVLMADDNRLLRVMLEEELGLSLAVYEHPLKQAFGAALGTLFAGVLILASLFFLSYLGSVGTCLALVMIGAYSTAKIERNQALPLVIWSLGIALLSYAMTYFLFIIVK